MWENINKLHFYLCRSVTAQLTSTFPLKWNMQAQLKIWQNKASLSGTCVVRLKDCRCATLLHFQALYNLHMGTGQPGLRSHCLRLKHKNHSIVYMSNNSWLWYLRQQWQFLWAFSENRVGGQQFHHFTIALFVTRHNSWVPGCWLITGSTRAVLQFGDQRRAVGQL